ncbi:MAG: hypothetical protein QXP36_04480 [Conexivisphaerales archaeon]
MSNPQVETQIQTSDEDQVFYEVLTEVSKYVEKLNKLVMSDNVPHKLITNLRLQLGERKDYSKDHRALITFMLDVAENSAANIANRLIDIVKYFNKAMSKTEEFRERVIALDIVYHFLSNVLDSTTRIDTIVYVLCQQEELCAEDLEKEFDNVGYFAANAKDTIKKYLANQYKL